MSVLRFDVILFQLQFLVLVYDPSYDPSVDTNPEDANTVPYDLEADGFDQYGQTRTHSLPHDFYDPAQAD